MNPQLQIRAGLAAGLAVAALLAASGPAPAEQTDTHDAIMPQATSETPTAPADDLRSPDARDAGMPSKPVPGVPVFPTDQTPIPRAVPAAPVADDSGFQWDDAAIGAGGTLGLVLLLAGGSAAIYRRQHSAHGRLAS